MLVYGMLEKAQLELTGNPASETFTPLARVIADKTTPTDVRPYFWNGTEWKQFQFVEPSPSGIFSQNSGTACTVDWSVSLIQEVVLTGNCVISFSNPQANQRHTLIVRKTVENSTYNEARFAYTLNMPTQDPDYKNFQRQVNLLNGNHDTFEWIYKTPFIPAITTAYDSQYAGQDILILLTGVGISPDGEMVAGGRSTTPFANFLPIRKTSKNNRAVMFGGANDRAPTALAGSIKDIAFHPSAPVAYFAGATTPFIQGYFLDNTNLSLKPIPNPGTIPTGAAQCCNVSPNGRALAVGHATSPFITVYDLNFYTANLGNKVTNPSTLPAAQVNAVKFSPLGKYLAVATQTTPFLEVYEMDTNGQVCNFISKVANPGVLPAGGPSADKGGDGIAWRPQGDYIAMAMSVTPYIYVVPFNRLTGTFGTPVTFTDTTVAAVAGNVSVAWSPCGRYLYTAGVGVALGNFFACYDFQNFTLGSALWTVASVAQTTCNGMEITPDGNSIVMAVNDTRGMVSIALEQPAKEYLRVL